MLAPSSREHSRDPKEETDLIEAEAFDFMSQVTKGVTLPAIEDEYDEFLKAFGRRIKQLRNERGLSLRDMVVLHGYHDSQWRRMERGGAGNVQSLLKIARAFQISLSVLLDGLGEYPTTSMKDVKKHAAKSAKNATKKSE